MQNPSKAGRSMKAGGDRGEVADSGVAYAVADIGGRDTMEDEHVLLVEPSGPLRVLGAVFDGHGGKAVARLARERFPAIFLSSLGSAGPEAAFRGAFAA